MTIKESYTIAGSPTTWGLPEMKDNVTDTSALAVERLEKAGANIFGKTNVPVLLADWQSYNEVYGTTNNPWNTALTPGGSSGGSAAALAAGLTGVDAGSDIGSSIRNPAHYCGVFGLKPTYGIIPLRRHALPRVFAPTDISVVGPLTRGAQDLDIMLDVMAGPDELDDACWRLELPPSPTQSLKDLRIAVKLSDPNSETDSEYAGKLQALDGEGIARGDVGLHVRAPPGGGQPFDVEGFLHGHRHAMQRTEPLAPGRCAVCLARPLPRLFFVEQDDGVDLRVVPLDAFEVKVEQVDRFQLPAADQRGKLSGGEERDIHGRSLTYGRETAVFPILQ
jgi:hypothetical protein